MGCDIHGWVERRIEGKWVSWCELKDRTRNYSRFSALAGVRGQGPHSKGLPDDISETAHARAEGWGSDGHSHSWLPLKDAFEIFEKNRFTREGDHYSEYTAFGVEIDDESDWEKYRLVFWFDN